ncbi:MAG TPA: BamA/TamA family outer membrane protein [Polyangiaceae bacterium]|nr:BamA/TamA family outer membrane protein [Polyangiaceae bacterium]
MVRFAATALGLLFVLTASLAHAQQGRLYDESPARTTTSSHEADGEGKHDTDVTVIPYGGADTDIGVGVGVMGSVARKTPDHDPYLWRVESVSLVTFKSDADPTDPKVEFPYIDAYLLLSLPHAVKKRLGLDFRVSYTRELALKYYGLGNASEVPAGAELGDPRFEYAREHPTFRLRSESRFFGSALLIVGFAYTHNWITVPPDTLLAEDRESENARVREALVPTGEHGVAEFTYGLGWDSRNNRVSTTSGHYHTASITLAPGGVPAVPQSWARANGSLRFYIPLVVRRLTLAVRGVGDLLFGDPPFYELPRSDESNAIGGAKGVRGVPAQRYYGKIKIFSNLELRSRLFDFSVFGQKNSLGAVAFADTGRLWSDYPPDPELDGDFDWKNGFGLKYGVGGGLRLYGGTSFVVRADVAWSPDARPFGGYLGAGEVF